MTSGYQKTKPFTRLLYLIVEDRRELVGITIYAALNSLLLLAIPLAAQALVNVSAAGLNFQPLLVLAGGLCMGLLFAGLLTCLRYYLSEFMLQRIFARVAMRVARRLPDVKSDELCKRGGPELMNRFFDVINIQKSWFKLVFEVPGALLDLILGLTLLSLYGTDLFLAALGFVSFGGLVVALAGWGGVNSSIAESACKYEVAEWLEEMVRCRESLRANLRPDFWLEEADRRVVDYLTFRRKHFAVLLRQVILHYGITAFALAGMLGYGGYLVLQGDLSLGQLVAAELVVWSLFKAIEKLLRSWESYFDLLTGLDKVGYIIELPTETRPDRTVVLPGQGGVALEVSDLCYAHEPDKPNFLNEVTFSVPSGGKVAVLGGTGAGKSTLFRLLGGYLQPRSGAVELEFVDVRELSLDTLSRTIGLLTDRNELFAGSLVDNVAVGRDCDLHRLRELLMETGGRQALRDFSMGGFTQLTSAGSVLSSGERTSLLVSRALLGKPRLLLLDHNLSELPEDSVEHIVEMVFKGQDGPTVLTTSTHPLVVEACDRILVLEKGRVVEEGTPRELASNSESRFCITHPTLAKALADRLKS